jgi:hypothetical protein
MGNPFHLRTCLLIGRAGRQREASRVHSGQADFRERR